MFNREPTWVQDGVNLHRPTEGMPPFAFGMMAKLLPSSTGWLPTQ